MKPLIYLATPYSHKEESVRKERFDTVNMVAGRLMQEGNIVFSPISYTHPIAMQCDLPKDWQYWEKLDRAYLSCSHKLMVLCVDGWMESTGVQAEIKIAKEYGIPIEYIHIEELKTALMDKHEERGLELRTTNGSMATGASAPSAQICPHCGGMGCIQKSDVEYDVEQCEHCQGSGKLHAA